ncbi:hypothetical protein B4U80_08360 [Leptotrombidium deliense]|uniref:Uncharacterized protein n=1 Tax=Leptotrombidium deliense TaxID=299467 RepID=A0A443RSX8_9ACAR|nr:hypothetical protein B4U80_08360 [Leptotrombidium deliense]
MTSEWEQSLVLPFLTYCS